MTFDASFVIWIATADDAIRVPASLRSWFIEFFIQSPLGQQALQVPKYISESVFQDLNIPEMKPVPSNISKLLAHLTAREQMQLLKRAYASAYDDDRTCIEIRDIPNFVFSDDHQSKSDQDDEKPRLIH
ncbi:MAG: hypothetical protein PHQ58_11735 [Rhodoferax sp.]|uniref:hypothetical protein n=1 Tax=Rhodoferax sp. TaxID=50421 RepID=UPI00260F3B7E|nr:hypothetical protein [Rhodoferax sp.]MDD2881099.1 hypothetical protein [Rhodoferax sp.]